MSDTFTLQAPTNAQSIQGALSSQYTNWVASQVTTNAEWIAFTWWASQGSNADDLSQAKEIQAALENGSFSVTDLFNVANGKTSNNDDVAGSPDPKLVVAGVTIDLDQFLSGEATTEWTAGNAKNTVYHQREYLTEFTSGKAPDGWDTEQPNNPPEVEAIAVDITETVSKYNEEHEITNLDPDNKVVDLLDTNYVSDPDSDPLSVVSGSVTLSNGDALPSWITVDGNNLVINQNSRELDDYLNGELDSIQVKYVVTDGEDEVANLVNIDLTGTADQYKASETDSVSATHEKTGSGSGQQFNDQVLLIDPNQVPLNSIDEENFSGFLTATTSGFSASNQSGTVSDRNQDDWDLLSIDALHVTGSAGSSDSAVLVAGALDDGAVTYNGNFSGNAPVGAEITVTLQYTYDYWFVA